MGNEDGLQRNAHRRDDPDADGRCLPAYLTTEQAAAYLGKSVSWLLRQGDIPYLPGRPNMYRRMDLDNWFERHMYKPRV